MQRQRPATFSPQTLSAVIAQLVKNAGENKRMANAVRSGAELIRENRVVILDDDTVQIFSTSGETYKVSLCECTNAGTGDNCPAFQMGFPCKHRAALHILMMIQAEAEKGHECGTCGMRFHHGELLSFRRRRIRAGAVMPSGACRNCGGYCFPREEERGH